MFKKTQRLHSLPIQPLKGILSLCTGLLFSWCTAETLPPQIQRGPFIQKLYRAGSSELPEEKGLN